MVTRVLALAAAACMLSPISGAASAAAQATTVRDGQRDFDWEIGTWKTVVKVRRNPLSGTAPDWADYAGTSVVKPLLEGRANFVELSVAGGRGKIEGGSLRLYNAKSCQWSLNYATGGVLTAPVFGGFDGHGRGAFYGQDTLGGKAILVRFIVTVVSPREARFEQAYSADGGQSWEDNWIAIDTLQ